MPLHWLLDPSEQLLSCPSLALRPERMFVSACGILSGGVLYTVVSAAGGPRGEGALGNLFYFIGLSLWILCLILAAGGVSRAVLQELGGGPPLGIVGIFSYLRAHWKSLVLIPVAFCALSVGGVLAQTFMAIVGAIPGIGPLLYALSFSLGVAFSMLAVRSAPIHVLGIPLYPAALSYRDAGPVEVIRELLMHFQRRPGWILLAEAGVTLASAAVGWALATLLSLSLRLTVAISQPAMGERFQRLVAGLPEPLYPLFERLAGPIPFYFVTGEGSAAYLVSGLLLGFSFLALLSVVFAYPFTLLVSGGTALYASLRSPEDAAHA